jgi:hypothetical protein
MSDRGKTYPDNTAIHARKAEWRAQQARLPFAEKLAILDRMKARVAPLVRARENRKARQDHP